MRYGFVVRVVLPACVLAFLVAVADAGSSRTAGAGAVAEGITVRVSVTSEGREEQGDSDGPATSADGNVVAFESSASLVGDDDQLCEFVYPNPRSENCRDVFVHERGSGETVRVSVAADGGQGNASSSDPTLSADGRTVAFVSRASNLVSGDTNGTGDVFVHERDSGETVRVSVAPDGSEANGWSWDPSLSADGRLVAFNSSASNLVAGDNNAAGDVFVHDRDSGETVRVSAASDGSEGNGESWQAALAGDGRRVAFVSEAGNLVANDGNGVADVFVHDLESGETVRVSIATDGTEGNMMSWQAALSGDGRLVAFVSDASTLWRDVGELGDADLNGHSDVFVHDLETGETALISTAADGSQANERSGSPALSADGRKVAFYSYASNLVSGDGNEWGDVFVHDLDSGETVRVSVAWNGAEANDWSDEPALSADGRIVAFASRASNLVSDDGNVCSQDVEPPHSCRDVFVRVGGREPVYLPFFGG